jgi:tripeptidyl-peptidase-1
MQFDARVEVLEDLIKAKFHEFEHVDTGSTHIAADEYHVPAHIQEHVDYITPGINLMSTKTKTKGRSSLNKRNNFGFPRISDAVGPGVEVLTAAAAGDLSSCSAIMTPGCIMAMYNITPSTTNVTGNQLGIFEDIGETFAQSTLNYFFKGFAQYVPTGTKPVIAGIDGGEKLYPVTPTEAGFSETDLDLEAAIPLIYPQGVILFQTDDKNYELNYTYDGFFNNFYDAIDGSCKSFDIPLSSIRY